MRMLDFIQGSAHVTALGSHDIVKTPAGYARPPKIDADIIVSHIVLSWRNLPFFFALRARHPRKTIVHIEHHYSAAFEAAEVTKQARFRAMLRVSLSLFDRVVAISKAQRDWLRDGVGASDATMHLIPSCVSLDAFLAVDPPAGPICRIGAIGRLHPQKGFDVLISAFRAAALQGVVLDVFGDGPDRQKLDALAEGDPSIVFHGHVNDPIKALASVDAVAMPSRREPYGLVALETIASGRPLLVSVVDGLQDHAAMGAIPVDTLSVAAWRDALRNLCRNPNRQRAAAARERVRKAESRFAESWAALVQAVTKN